MWNCNIRTDTSGRQSFWKSLYVHTSMRSHKRRWRGNCKRVSTRWNYCLHRGNGGLYCGRYLGLNQFDFDSVMACRWSHTFDCILDAGQYTYAAFNRLFQANESPPSCHFCYRVLSYSSGYWQYVSCLTTWDSKVRLNSVVAAAVQRLRSLNSSDVHDDEFLFRRLFTSGFI